jgi:hypothetical protein
MKRFFHSLACPQHKIIDLCLPIRVFLITGLILLPFSHLRWLPNLGTTRPVSSILFVFSLGLIVLNQIITSVHNSSFRITTLFSIRYIRLKLQTMPGWQIIVPWIILILMGIISAAITPFYGNFFQALNRLLGYGIIFATLFCGLFAIKLFGMQKIATWISLGYLPVLIYGIIEAMATENIIWAVQIVFFVRTWIVVNIPWVYRVAFFTTEPSFVGFQLILLIAVIPYLQSRTLRLTNILIILLAIIFTKSATVLIEIFAYIAFLIFFNFKATTRILLLTAGGLIAFIAGIWYTFYTQFRVNLDYLKKLSEILKIERIYLLGVSSSIRGSYFRNLLYTILDTHGLGLGIGQYGQFWKDIYLRHFNPQAIDPTGEIVRSLASPEYGRPWSAIFGIGVDLGIVGMLVLFGFFYQVWHFLKLPHCRAIFLTSIIALLGAYPIVTPHVWLALALLAGASAAQILEKSVV